MPRPCSVLLCLLLACQALAAPQDWFAIHVVDEATGRGVPLITLKTTSGVECVTDSAGWIAFNEPGLMGTEVFFHVSGPGYAVPKDGFGYSGVRLTPRAGDKAEVKVVRQNIAERLYRSTGQGIYRDSELLGRDVPLPRPNLNCGVTGQDSVQALRWQGRLLWLWGDTSRARYPLGNFHTTCAWSDLPDKGGLDPAHGIHLEYITDEGEVRPMLPMDAPGPVWIFGLLTARDAAGAEHLVGHFSRMKDLGTVLEHGLAEFDAGDGRFRPLIVLGEEFTWQHPRGNAVRARDEDGDSFYFAHPFATTRVKASYESLQSPGAYEALTWSAKEGEYVWQSDQPPLTQEEEARLIRAKKLPATRALLQLKDAATDKEVLVHGASINWNEHRQRWIMIALQNKGADSLLGEVWYAEAPAVTGPWTRAVKIASHPRQSFYNPRHHPFFDQEGGRIIYFEGTYTHTFSGNPVPTPRYEYNQLMYRLDLEDPRLEAARK